MLPRHEESKHFFANRVTNILRSVPIDNLNNLRNYNFNYISSGLVLIVFNS